MMLATVCSLVLLGPPLVLRDVDGKRHTLVGDRSKRATVVFVLLRECPIARKYAPEIGRIVRDYRARGVAFYTTYAESVKPAEVRQYQKEFAIPCPGLLANAEVMMATGAKVVPTAAVFSPRGERLYGGRIDDRFPALGVLRAPRVFDLRRALDQVLANQPVRPAQTRVIGCALTP